MASRFGRAKLTEDFRGMPLGEYALRLYAALPFQERILVTQRCHETLVRTAQELGFLVCFNDAPERGISSSIALGLSCLKQEDGSVLFGVCDQPFLSRETVSALMQDAEQHPCSICAPFYAGQRGNPVVFPLTLREELLSLTGDTGGGKVIRNHPDLIMRVDRPSIHELDDIDTLQDLHSLQ